MPRPPRLNIPEISYHITNRGVKKLPLFLEPSDYQKFIQLLLVTCAEFPFHLHAYCFMTNHYHLLLEMKQDSLSEAIQYLNGYYGGYFNRKYKHTGHLFQGRFHSIPVLQDSYFTVASRYIHLNPYRAGMVARPEDYLWSNYKATIKGLADPIADSSFLLGYFGKDVAGQREGYKEFVKDAMDKNEPISEKALQRMRSWGTAKPHQEQPQQKNEIEAI